MEEEDFTVHLTCILPGDLILKILTNLPLKSLIRFRSVCKSWYSLFVNPKFIKSHYDYSSQVETDSFLTISSDGINTELGLIPPNSNKWESLGIGFSGQFEIVGSCQGFICLTPFGHKFGQEFVIMNPALRESKLINKPFEQHDFDKDFVSVGFIFMEQTRDFKIVRFEQHQPSSSQPLWYYEISIYSLNADSWKTIECLREARFRSRICRAVLGTCLYWLSMHNPFQMAAFDLSTETFHNVPLPVLLGKYYYCQQVVTWKQDSLAVIFPAPPSRINNEIWTISGQVLKQHTMHSLDKESWKLEKICTMFSRKVVAARRNGDCALRGRCPGNVILLYSQEKNNVENLWLPRHDQALQICCYKESLIPLNGKKELMGQCKDKLVVDLKEDDVVMTDSERRHLRIPGLAGLEYIDLLRRWEIHENKRLKHLRSCDTQEIRRVKRVKWLKF